MATHETQAEVRDRLATTMQEATVAGTLTVGITESDARAMRALGYRLMWTVALDGRVLGWGHGHRRASVELDAFEFAAEEVDADQVTDIAVLYR